LRVALPALATDRKKYPEYYIETDPDQDDKATELRMCSFRRPHMRAFHGAWFGFFMAFFIWFAIAPLLPEIRKTLKLRKSQVWMSSVCGVLATIGVRFILGPICDKYGPRIPFSALLCLVSIPTACTGLVNSAAGLNTLRIFIGFAGGIFVTCLYWTTRMFTKKVVGTANGIVGGWGNLGGGVTHLIVGTFIFPAIKAANGGDHEQAWRLACVFPAIVTFFYGIWLYYGTDDSPKGNYAEMKKYGAMSNVSAAASFRDAALNFNTWIMFVQYGCCFGVELTMYNATALYFHDEFGQTTENAAAIASLFGWLNIFCRPYGGYLSDWFNARWGMRGRIGIHTFFLLVEGALVLVFAECENLGFAIFIMVVFSGFVQAAAGSSFGIVPYIDPPVSGAISGVVGAGGNTGAVCFQLGFRNLEYKEAFVLMGSAILGSTILSVFINIKGCSCLLWGVDEEPVKVLALPDNAEPKKASGDDAVADEATA
jgi:MFS transporter, NNP family, nitrate/nitrite transporter